MGQPELEVISSLYNPTGIVHASIQSVLRHLSNNEIFTIVIDDEVSSDYLELQREYPEINWVWNRRNIGLTKSLNVAIKQSKSKYIARHDLDDISYATRFATQKQFLLNFNLDFCTSGFDTDKAFLPKNFVKFWPHSTLLNMYRNFHCHGTFFGVREVFLELYDERYKYAQDYEFLLRIRKKYRVGFTDEQLYSCGSSESQISVLKKREQQDFFKKARRQHYPILSRVIPSFC